MRPVEPAAVATCCIVCPLPNNACSTHRRCPNTSERSAAGGKQPMRRCAAALQHYVLSSCRKVLQLLLGCCTSIAAAGVAQLCKECHLCSAVKTTSAACRHQYMCTFISHRMVRQCCAIGRTTSHWQPQLLQWLLLTNDRCSRRHYQQQNPNHAVAAAASAAEAQPASISEGVLLWLQISAQLPVLQTAVQLLGTAYIDSPHAHASAMCK
jgi:hypothetical protein